MHGDGTEIQQAWDIYYSVSMIRKLTPGVIFRFMCIQLRVAD
jgi:hypothetical protein